MKLYMVTCGVRIETVEVIKETPKGYKVDPETSTSKWKPTKFIKKTNETWFPTHIMALKYGREILKKRILCYIEAAYKANQRKAEATAELAAFDGTHRVVGDDSLSEESYWMELQREKEAEDEK